VLLTVAALVLVARRLAIPYPILFVIGGLLLGLIPVLPNARFEPELVFLFSCRCCCSRRRCSPVTSWCDLVFDEEWGAVENHQL